jgi:hypothetical protein
MKIQTIKNDNVIMSFVTHDHKNGKEVSIYLNTEYAPMLNYSTIKLGIEYILNKEDSLEKLTTKRIALFIKSDHENLIEKIFDIVNNQISIIDTVLC